MGIGFRSKLNDILAEKKVLVVGAGGIGCELLKNLVLTGFKNIHVIDLDTIDVSNLNRQFLFRREHVSKSKAEVASTAVSNLLPGVNIKFDHDSIFNGDKFGISFFKSFDLVMNALDNRAARNHVNRLCLSAEIPLVESGSAGYLGQVSVILRGETECYECVAKPAASKTYPGCTIRNTPSEHIHCTVWSKHCFNQLFGEIDIDDDVSPDLDDPENRKTAMENGEDKEKNDGEEKSEEETPTNGDIPNTRKWAEETGYNAKMLFNKLFHDDILYLLKMKDLWKQRRPPHQLLWGDLESEGHDGGSTEMSDDTSDIMKQWTIAACARVFEETVNALKKRKEALPEGDVLHWDKDDEDGMRFVAACANIRAHIFGIHGKSLFEIKSMAGNIIPAIATTNAVVAGMVVVEAIKILRGRRDQARTVFINRRPNPRGKILMDQVPDKPNPHCFVCSSEKREVFVRANLHTMTVKIFTDRVVKGHFAVQSPDVMVMASAGIIISSDPEEDCSALESRFLSAVSGIADGSILSVDDYSQDLNFTVILLHGEALNPDEFQIEQDTAARKPEKEEQHEVEEKRKRKSMAGGEEEELESDAKRMRVDSVEAVA